MLLQLDIDCFTLIETLHVTEELADLVDIIEAGRSDGKTVHMIASSNGHINAVQM